jgi:hypothetical protein
MLDVQEMLDVQLDKCGTELCVGRMFCVMYQYLHRTSFTLQILQRMRHYLYHGVADLHGNFSD